MFNCLYLCLYYIYIPVFLISLLPLKLLTTIFHRLFTWFTIFSSPYNSFPHTYPSHISLFLSLYMQNPTRLLSWSYSFPFPSVLSLILLPSNTSYMQMIHNFIFFIPKSSPFAIIVLGCRQIIKLKKINPLLSLSCIQPMLPTWIPLLQISKQISLSSAHHYNICDLHRIRIPLTSPPPLSLPHLLFIFESTTAALFTTVCLSPKLMPSTNLKCTLLYHHTHS